MDYELTKPPYSMRTRNHNKMLSLTPINHEFLQTKIKNIEQEPSIIDKLPSLPSKRRDFAAYARNFDTLRSSQNHNENIRNSVELRTIEFSKPKLLAIQKKKIKINPIEEPILPNNDQFIRLADILNKRII